MLLRGTPEMFNPQIHTEELSLTRQMDKKFEVHNTVLSRFERYCKFTSFLFHSGRVNGGVRNGWIKRPAADQVISDNAYRVQFRSLMVKPAYATGGALFGAWFDTNNPTPDMSAVTTVTYQAPTNAGNVQTDVIGSIAVKHDPANGIFGDKFNPMDQIVLDGGLGINLWIQRVRRASTNDHFIYDFKVIGENAHYSASHIAEDEVLMEGGNLFGEGSLKGYQRTNSNYWKIYYSLLSRYSLSFTGHSLDQKRVVWTDKTVEGLGAPTKGSAGSRLWQFEREWEADEYFGLFLELACRFQSSSMDPSTHSWFENSGRNLLTLGNMAPEAGINPPRVGKGWIRQFQDTIDFSYDVNAGLSPYLLQGICNLLAGNSPIGSSGNTFIIVGDDVAYDNWDTGMKKLMGWVPNGSALNAAHNTNIVMDVTSGKKVELGFTIEAYHYKNNKFVFMTDELFSHPGLNKRNGGLVGNGNMYFLNVSMNEGVSNFELFTRGKGRFYKKKYVDGLHSLLNEDTMLASSGFDGAFVHYLAELFPVVYHEETCAILRGQGSFNGGALSGMAGIGNFPTITP
jgi:hypothetical protein